MNLKCTLRSLDIVLILLICLQLQALATEGSSNTTETKDFYSHFISQARYHSVDYDAPYEAKDIPWLDVNLLDRAARFVKENYIGVSMAHLYSLIEVFALKPTSSVLLATRHFSNVTSAYKRVLRTLIHIKEWNLSGRNILNPKSNAYKSLQSIRRKHKSAASVSKDRSLVEMNVENNFVSPTLEDWEVMRAIQADLAFVDTSEAPQFIHHWDSTTPLGQFDLGVVQFWFFGHTIMSPQSFGIYPSSVEDLKAFIHLWAVIGRVLGIQDQFNVALNLPLNMYRQFYNNLIVASLKNVDVRIISMMNNTMEGVYRHFLVPSMMRFKCWLHYGMRHTIQGFRGHNIFRLMNLEDKVCLQLFVLGAGQVNIFKPYVSVSALAFNTWIRQEAENLSINEF